MSKIITEYQNNNQDYADKIQDYTDKVNEASEHDKERRGTIPRVGWQVEGTPGYRAGNGSGNVYTIRGFPGPDKM